MESLHATTRSHVSKQVVKFRVMPVSRAIVALALLALSIVFVRQGLTIAKGWLTDRQWASLMGKSFCLVFLIAGVLFTNLTGETTDELARLTPLAQLLLANLLTVILVGMFIFLLFLQFA